MYCNRHVISDAISNIIDIVSQYSLRSFMTKGKIGVISLGCDKNRVDSEMMLSKLVNGGYMLTNDCNEADVIVVNTCAFLESARQEAINTILEMADYKSNGVCKSIVVTGCLGQKYGDEVYKHLTEADLVVGINQYDDIVELIDNQLTTRSRNMVVCPNGSKIQEGERVLTTASHTAYVKIGDGCNNYCSYCLIPFIRGAFRSRSMDSIHDEVVALVNNGVREIILVAQDVTRYGWDRAGKSQLVELIELLSNIEQLQWIRLLYCYPELVDDRLIDTIVNNDKVVNYLDIPLQHIDDKILSKMNRRCTEQDTYKLFDKLTSKGITIRTTFICGFPGETPDTHQSVLDFISKYKLKNVGFFAYSREEGTRAYDMPDQVDEQDKQVMVEQLYALQQDIATDNSRAEIGKTLPCMIDSMVESGDCYVYVGRCYYMTPDIDGVVFVHSDSELEIGQIYDVVITDCTDYDLVGGKV